VEAIHVAFRPAGPTAPGVAADRAAGRRRQHCADGQSNSTPEKRIYNNNPRIQFNLIVFT
jgi:hypothetical protein